jgi:hypothetical protein
MSNQRDLIVLVADLDAENVVRTLFERRVQALCIREVVFDLVRHNMRDSGCRREGSALLRNYLRTHRHAMILFDLHGSGRDQTAPEEVETEVEAVLRRDSWGERAACVVLAPELENWVWSPSPEVDAALGWHTSTPSLRDFLVAQGYPPGPDGKPGDPKAAMQAALRKVRKPHSARVFAELAAKVGLRGCQDRSFQKFITTLQTWFPVR